MTCFPLIRLKCWPRSPRRGNWTGLSPECTVVPEPAQGRCAKGRAPGSIPRLRVTVSVTHLAAVHRTLRDLPDPAGPGRGETTHQKSENTRGCRPNRRKFPFCCSAGWRAPAGRNHPPISPIHADKGRLRFIPGDPGQGSQPLPTVTEEELTAEHRRRGGNERFHHRHRCAVAAWRESHEKEEHATALRRNEQGARSRPHRSSADVSDPPRNGGMRVCRAKVLTRL